MARMLIGLGITLIVLGLLFHFKDSLPFLKYIGRLPGDLVIKDKNSTLYIPITTCLLVSLFISALMRLWR